MPMLRLHPDKRAKASELVHHNFLEGIMVQGEIDVIRRMELEEADNRKRLHEAAQANTAGGRAEHSRSRSRGKNKESQDHERERVDALDQSERDAMKPVEDSVLVEDDSEFEDETKLTAQEYAQQQMSHHQQQAPVLNAAPQPPSATNRPVQRNMHPHHVPTDNGS